MKKSINDCITEGAAFLKLNQVFNPRLESKIILGAALHLSPEQLLFQQNTQLEEHHRARFNEFLKRRARGEPIAYITQNKEFYSINFFVNKDVLIPRPDTEILVQKILDHHSTFDTLHILELGVGSGCIILALLKHLPNAIGLGVDVSEKALNIAQRNAIELKVENRIKFKQSNWYQNVTGKFDVIVSNPPYVSKTFIPSRELSFEPDIALFAALEGMEHYQQIAHSAKAFLKNGGTCYIEIGKDTAEQTTDIFYKNGLELIETYKDLAQIERCLRFAPGNNT
jgi:release factor glutamine methyltransferase